MKIPFSLEPTRVNSEQSRRRTRRRAGDGDDDGENTETRAFAFEATTRRRARVDSRGRRGDDDRANLSGRDDRPGDGATDSETRSRVCAWNHRVEVDARWWDSFRDVARSGRFVVDARDARGRRRRARARATA